MEILRSCSYGTLERSNRVVFEDRFFSFILTLGIFYYLFNNLRLKRLYTPLSTIVNITLTSIMLQNITYFLLFSYIPLLSSSSLSSEISHGNCIEIILSRLSLIGIMLGELHQFYLLANVLGVGETKIIIFRGYYELKLINLLRCISLFMIVSILGTLIIRKMKVLRNVWYIFSSFLQSYIIKQSVTDAISGQIISGTEPSVTLYKKLSLLQILPSIICLIYRLILVTTDSNFLSHFEVMFCHFDTLCDILSFLKILIIAENANVAVDIL
jgi:hypothetical protein